MKVLFTELTRGKFTAKLQSLQSKQETLSAKTALASSILIYADIKKKTSQIVRNDLITLQQHHLTQQIINSRKVKQIRRIVEGRDRKLKSEEFPELNIAPEYALGALDTQKGGGGLESHPRLTTGTLYRGGQCYHNATSQRNPSFHGSFRVYHITEFVLHITLTTFEREAFRQRDIMLVEK